MLQAFINWLIPFVCGGVITALSIIVRKKTKKEQAEYNGTQCLLRAEIIRQHEKYSELGHCQIYAKESLKKAYSAYHDLGGNDVATRLYEEIMKLPIKEEEE